MVTGAACCCCCCCCCGRCGVDWLLSDGVTARQRCTAVCCSNAACTSLPVPLRCPTPALSALFRPAAVHPLIHSAIHSSELPPRLLAAQPIVDRTPLDCWAHTLQPHSPTSGVAGTRPHRTLTPRLAARRIVHICRCTLPAIRRLGRSLSSWHTAVARTLISAAGWRKPLLQRAGLWALYSQQPQS